MTTPPLADRSIGLLACLTRWAVILSVFFYLCGYAFDVHERRTKEPVCQ